MRKFEKKNSMVRPPKYTGKEQTSVNWFNDMITGERIIKIETKDNEFASLLKSEGFKEVE